MTPFWVSPLLPICGPGQRAQAFPMSHLPQTNKPQAHIPSTPDDGLCKPTTAGPAIQMPGFRHARMRSRAHSWGGGVRPCSKRVSPGSLASQFKTCVQLLVAPGFPAPAIPICTPETRSWKVCKPPSPASSANMPPTDMDSQKAHYFRNICA